MMCYYLIVIYSIGHWLDKFCVQPNHYHANDVRQVGHKFDTLKTDMMITIFYSVGQDLRAFNSTLGGHFDHLIIA